MGLETATYISQLVDTNPAHSDDMNEADAHMRLIKNVLQSQFPAFTAAAVASTNAEIDAAAAGAYPGNVSVGGTFGVTGVTTLSGLTKTGAFGGNGVSFQSGSTYTIAATDFLVFFSADLTIVTLPDANTCGGRMLFFTTPNTAVHSASNNITHLYSSGPGSDNFIIDSEASDASAAALLVANGADNVWQIVLVS